MFEISEVVLANTTKTIKHRKTKSFVRVSITNEKFLIINSRESEGSIKIESAIYSFLSHDSYIAGFRTFALKEDEIIKIRGTLNYDDMIKVQNMIKNSKFISQDEKEEILIDLEAYIKTYVENKLKSKFHKK